jgi:hypothetical protein
VSDWFEEGGTGAPVDVGALLDGQGVAESLAAIVGHGALLSVGRTSDGGALGVTVTMDGRWRREYFREAELLAAWLDGAASAVEVEAGRLAASADRGTRKRRARGL